MTNDTGSLVQSNRMNDEYFMRLAITEAKKGDFPYGAVITKNGKVISKAYNSMLHDTDSTAHAEINAIRKACQNINSVKLPNCTIYVTVIPCPMCFSAVWRAEIKKIVYAVELPDRMNIDTQRLNQMSGNKITIVGGVLEKEASKLYKKVGN